MFGLFLKKLSITDATVMFMRHICQRIEDSLPEVRDLIQKYCTDGRPIDDVHLCNELLSAVLAISLQPVLNIWDISTFEKVRREVVRQIEDRQPPDDRYPFDPHLEQYLAVWRTASINMPWDEVTGRFLSNLGAAPMMPDSKYMSPYAVSLVSTALVVLATTPFWKDLKEHYRLS